MSSTTNSLNASTQRDIEVFLDKWRDEKDIPGASVAIFDRDGIRYATGQGARDIDTRSPATPDTRYPFASVSKIVTAMAVLQLVDQGELRLDDEIRQYVSFWTDVPGDPITVKELLTHSSGMPSDYAGNRTYLFGEDPPASPLVTLEDLRRHTDGATDQRIVDETRFMYNDRNYHILGMLVETVEDRPFDEVIEEKLFAPLGMTESTIGYGKLSEIDDAITGYVIEEGEPTVTDLDLDAMGLGPAVNGVLASVSEMAELIRCLLNGGELDGTRVLEEDLAEAMCSHQVTTRETIDGDSHGMGYGPRVQEFLGETYVYHTGTAPGVGRAYAGFLPDRGVGVTLGVNTTDVRVEVLGEGVLALVAGRDPEEAVPFLALSRKVRAVAGTYESSQGNVTVHVEPAGSDSYVEVSKAGWEFPAFPESTAADDYEFYSVWAGGWRGSIEFHETETGMELRMNDQRLQRTHFES